MKRITSFFKNRDGETDVRRILFNIVTIGGSLGGMLSLLMSSALKISEAQIISICLAEAVLFSAFWLANWKDKLNAGAFLIIFVITLVLFPVMFITGGGLYGGMNLWFSLGIIFDFLLIEGQLCYLMLVLQITAILSCNWYAYRFPEKVTMLSSEGAVYVDTIQSLLVISIAAGLIVRFQNRVYKNKLKELEEANIALELAEQNANEANKAKSDFLANMSHEIRTPINAVIGMNEMILREAGDDTILEYATAVETSANTLLSIINDILDISKIEAGRIELSEGKYELRSMIQECYSFIHDRAEKKGLQIVVEVDPTLPSALKGDVLRVRQILVNFLTNAVKYSDTGVITFSLQRTVSKNEDEILLKATVKDQGIGIKKENIEHLFEKFERFDMKHNRNIEGTGLGLNITKMLVDMMGGEIQVESTYGVGSIFTVLIPQKVADKSEIGAVGMDEISRMQPVHKEYEQLFTAKDAKILMVDDVSMNHLVFQNMIKQTLVQVDTAMSGMEAIELAKQTRYDLIFMDHMMPHMDGIESFQHLKKEGLNTKTPVIMLTANAIAGMKEMFQEIGFVDYLTKPVNGTELEEMMMKYLPQEKVCKEEHKQEKEELQEAKKVQESEEIHQTSETIEENSEVQSQQGEIDLAHVKGIAGLDFEFAMSQCVGSEELYLELLNEYCQPSRMDNLYQSYEKADYDTYQVHVHALKSSSRMVGFSELGAFAEAQEMALKEKNMEYVATNHKSLMEAYENTIAEIYGG